MRFLAIGECMAEMSSSNKEGDFRLGFAGDTYNTAWYLARLRPDFEVSYFTAVGDDDISYRMLAAFDAAGIRRSHVQQIWGRSVGLYMISLKDGERSFSYWRGQSAARNLADYREPLLNAIDNADFIYFSGITLAILAPDGRDQLLGVLREARASGRLIAFDPNLRPSLWHSSEEMTEVIMQGAAVSDIVLPSFEDEAVWFKDKSPEATLARYSQAGAKTVIVKNGPNPVLASSDERFSACPVEALDVVVDTTAAGDSFNAGIFAHLLEAPLEHGIDAACRLASQVVQSRGALIPFDPADYQLNLT